MVRSIDQIALKASLKVNNLVSLFPNNQTHHALMSLDLEKANSDSTSDILRKDIPNKTEIICNLANTVDGVAFSNLGVWPHHAIRIRPHEHDQDLCLIMDPDTESFIDGCLGKMTTRADGLKECRVEDVDVMRKHGPGLLEYYLIHNKPLKPET